MKAFIQHAGYQGEKIVLQALVPFMDLKDSVLFTNKANPNGDDDKKVVSESNYKYYQRRIDLTRIKKIEDFIIDSILDEKDNIILATLFPSSMILAINEEDNEIKKNHDNDNSCDVTINSNVFIVDGQHRMMAMMRVYDKLQNRTIDIDSSDREYILNFIKKYKFNCTILVNYDLWEQGQVFINVNFKQKPVNKSLYYEIFGSEYRESKSDWRRNQIYLAHCMASVLNEDERSPYFGKVKMLGTGKGYISQAFIVESLLLHFRRNGIWEYNIDSAELREEEYSYFATELLSYFYAIKDLLPDYWPETKDDSPTIICKSTAFGAFVRLMPVVREFDPARMVRELKASSVTGDLCTAYIDEAEAVLLPLVKKGNTLFGKKSEFASTSGKGTESKLYKLMLHFIRNSYKPDGNLPSIVDPEDISMQLQEYLWTHPVDDLDSLAHSYEVEEISGLVVQESKESNGDYLITSSFEVSVSLYIDNDDSTGFSITFPATSKAIFKKINEALLLEEDSVDVNVDTDKFYQ